MKIEKQVVLRAPLERVWRAISDAKEFGRWFGVRFDGPFVAGASVTAAIVPTTVDDEVARRQEPHAGVTSTWQIIAVEPQRRFAYRWHPFAIDADHQKQQDYDREPTTLVEFTLAERPDGVLLTITESGFEAIPEARRGPSFEANGEGWAIQTTLVRKYIEGVRISGDLAPRSARRSPPFSTRSVTRTGCASSCGSAIGARARRRRSPASFRSPGRRPASTCSSWSRVGLVTSSRRGRERVWTVRTEPLASASDYLEQLSRRCDAAVDRLRAYVED